MASKAPDKTLEDIIVNATINTDRIELAIEKATHRIVTEIDSIPIPSSSSPSGPTIPTIIGPGKYDDKLIRIENAIDSVKETLFAVIATIIGAGILMMFMISWLVSSVQHIQNGSWTPDKEEVVEEVNGSEQNTSSEEEVLPQKPDQSHPQSSSDAPQQN